MKIIELNAYQTAMLAGLILLLGRTVSKQFPILKKYCIPDPVIGGIIYAISHAAMRSAGIVEISLDTTLQTFFMLIFYTGVGFTASYKLLKSGGKLVALFLVLTIGMCVLQNMTGAGIAMAFQIDPRIGVMAGSVPMVGGHATASAFAPVFEADGVIGAEAVGIASATFGLVMGCIIGGPIATRRIRQFGLSAPKQADLRNSGKEIIQFVDSVSAIIEDVPKAAAKEEKGIIDRTRFLDGMLFLVIATGIGSYICNLLQGITIMGRPFSFPQTIGGLLAGAIIRNIWDGFKREMPIEEIDTISGYSLSMFLGIAMINLKLWQLAELALPMMVMMLGQTVLMFLVAYFVIFYAMGRDYNAAVITAGFCGFGMGASPNAMANMQAVIEKYGPAPTAIFVVTMVAALFIDFFNSIVITIFLNIL